MSRISSQGSIIMISDDIDAVSVDDHRRDQGQAVRAHRGRRCGAGGG